MEKTTAILKNEYNTIYIRFYNICDTEAICVEYKYESSNSSYRTRSRKIYNDSKGQYVLYHKQKAYIE